MKKLLAILSVVLFANQASAWELFGLNENTKLEDLEVLEEKYSEFIEVYYYQILPPKPNALGNEYKIIYSKKHGICDVAMWAVWDKPYPYGKTVLSIGDFGVVLYNNWTKLLSILKKKYGEEDQRVVNTDEKTEYYIWHDWNETIKQYGFDHISISVPQNQNDASSFVRYSIASPGCHSGAEEDAADKNAESIGVSSDDF